MPTKKTSAKPKVSPPFPCFGHGKPRSRLEKAMESFIWFTRDVNEDERAAIQASAPEPSSGEFFWSDRFCYFGSAGDVFAHLVKDTGTPASFGEAYDRWLEETHRRAPIAFTLMPFAGKPDAWGQASLAAIDDALELAHDAQVVDRLDAEGARHHRYIIELLAEVLQLAPPDEARIATRLQVIAALSTALADELPIERVTSTESRLHSFGQAIANQLEGLSGIDRAGHLDRLPPLAHLFYLASYPALRAGDVGGSSLPETLRALIDAVPEERRRGALSLAVFIGKNIVHLTPGFGAPDFSDGAAARDAIQLAIDAGAADASAFLDQMRILVGIGDAKRAAALARRGFDTFFVARFATEGAAVAEGEGLTELASELKERAAGIEILEASVARVHALSNDASAAANVIDEVLATTRLRAPWMLANLARFYGAITPPPPRLDPLLEEMADGFATSAGFQTEAVAHVNFCIAAGNHARIEVLLRGMRAVRAKGVRLDRETLHSLAWAAENTATPAQIPALIDFVVEQVPRGNYRGITLWALAGAAMKLDDRVRVMAFLRRAYEIGDFNYTEVRTDTAFELLKGDPEFIAMFGRAS